MKTTSLDVMQPYPVLGQAMVDNSLKMISLIEESNSVARNIDFHTTASGGVGFRSSPTQVGRYCFQFQLTVGNGVEATEPLNGEFGSKIEIFLIFISTETRATSTSGPFPLVNGTNNIRLEVDASVVKEKFQLRTVILSQERFLDGIPTLPNYIIYEDKLPFSTGGQRDSLNIRQAIFEDGLFEKNFWRVFVEIPDSIEEMESYSISRAVAIEINANLLGFENLTQELQVILLSDVAAELVDTLVERSTDDDFFEGLSALMKRKLRNAPYFRDKSLLHFIHLVLSEMYIVELGVKRDLSRSAFIEGWARNRQSYLGIWRSHLTKSLNSGNKGSGK